MREIRGHWTTFLCKLLSSAQRMSLGWNVPGVESVIRQINANVRTSITGLHANMLALSTTGMRRSVDALHRSIHTRLDKREVCHRSLLRGLRRTCSYAATWNHITMSFTDCCGLQVRGLARGTTPSVPVGLLHADNISAVLCSLDKVCTNRV